MPVMMAFLVMFLLVQGGLPPNPDAIPPPASLRMKLNGCVESREPAVRLSRQFREHLTKVIDRKDLKLTRKEVALIKAVRDAAVPAAFWRYKDSEEKLKDADRQMRAGLSKAAVAAIGALPEREYRYNVCRSIL
jgi:hypothetical protein